MFLSWILLGDILYCALSSPGKKIKAGPLGMLAQGFQKLSEYPWGATSKLATGTQTHTNHQQ